MNRQYKQCEICGVVIDIGLLCVKCRERRVHDGLPPYKSPMSTTPPTETPTPEKNLDHLFSTAFETNHPAMLDWMNVKFRIIQLERELAASQDQVAALREAFRWISWRERMPTEDDSLDGMILFKVIGVNYEVDTWDTKRGDIIAWMTIPHDYEALASTPATDWRALAEGLATQLRAVLKQTDDWNASVTAIIGRQPETGIATTAPYEALAAFEAAAQGKGVGE